ncbi:MAG TPA: hypothetical protein VNJ05_09975, partial [Sphingomicrobium sp.]|nr:hypothetical protein [Sphingomicrobium sp.]
ASSLLALAQAGAAELKPVWEASGLKEPESAVYDPARDVIYVSNVNGEPAAKDGNGFIAKLSPKGEVVALEWVKGLDAPKGMALVGDTLYVSDMMANAIWVLEGGRFAEWLRDDALDHPNGLLAQDGRILVASWGRDIAADFSTKVPGHVKVVEVATKKIASLGAGTPLGNLDGIEPDGAGGYTVTDWLNGAIFHVSADGRATRLLDLNQGSADHAFIAKDRLVVLPMMLDGKVVAYRLD